MSIVDTTKAVLFQFVVGPSGIAAANLCINNAGSKKIYQNLFSNVLGAWAVYRAQIFAGVSYIKNPLWYTVAGLPVALKVFLNYFKDPKNEDAMGSKIAGYSNAFFRHFQNVASYTPTVANIVIIWAIRGTIASNPVGFGVQALFVTVDTLSTIHQSSAWQSFAAKIGEKPAKKNEGVPTK